MKDDDKNWLRSHLAWHQGAIDNRGSFTRDDYHAGARDAFLSAMQHFDVEAGDAVDARPSREFARLRVDVEPVEVPSFGTIYRITVHRPGSDPVHVCTLPQLDHARAAARAVEVAYVLGWEECTSPQKGNRK